MGVMLNHKSCFTRCNGLLLMKRTTGELLGRCLAVSQKVHTLLAVTRPTFIFLNHRHNLQTPKQLDPQELLSSPLRGLLREKSLNT